MWLQKEEGDCSRSRLPGPQLSWAHTSPHSIKRHRTKFNTQVGAWEATGTEQDPKVAGAGQGGAARAVSQGSGLNTPSAI